MEKGFLRGMAFAFALSPAFSFALDLKPDGVSFGYGQHLHSKARLDDYRASLRWSWNHNWLKPNNTWALTGYSDLAVNYWTSRLGAEDNPSPDGAGHITAVSFAPVFRLEHLSSNTLGMFLDAGIGLSYQSKKDIEKKNKSPINMGGNTQFEVRTLMGTRFGLRKQYEVSAGWFHYSNANFHSQNEALDFIVIQMGYWW